MSDTAINLTITHINEGPISFVRIECRDHMKAIVRIDMAPADFLSAVMGGRVIAALSLPKSSGSPSEHPIW